MTHPVSVLAGSYDYLFVALSVLIAILASYAALDLAGRVTSAQGMSRFLWLSGGAVAMGIGIWSMHYVGMLAFRLPIPVQYDWPTVLLSLLAAVFASTVALFVVSRHKMGMIRAVLGSVVMGGGIATMHYTGMAAMRMAAMCRYSPGLLTVSVVLAIVISLAALWLTFYSRGEITAWSWRKILSAFVMGAAIPIMHYTGMAAANFTPSPSHHEDLSHAVSVSSLSVFGICIVTLMILGLVLLTSLADRRFSLQALELESSRRHHQIIETSLDAFIEMDSDGLITDWNAQAETTFGWSRSEAIGQTLSQMIIPHCYREAHTQGLQRFLTTGEGPVLNKRVEITALHRDGTEFPIELSISAIIWSERRLFSAFVRDVTEQKRAQMQVLNLALIDDLTGLHNRRGFLALAEHHMKLAHRMGKPFLLAFVDLDGMKQINDTFGHQEGNRALVDAAHVLKDSFRQSDILARLGGDEFAILVADASGNSIGAVLHRTQRKLSSFNVAPGRRYELSFSIGVIAPDITQLADLEQLLSQADAVMYEQKQNKGIPRELPKSIR
jgi:diguanylate cyclase (GGDEF)-like protein/PAS domain S-box-containing protein